MGPADWIAELEAGWAREHPDADLGTLPPLVRLARLALLIEAFQTETLAPFDLTPADYSVLAALRRVGPPYRTSPSKLYSALQRSSGGMTKMLKRLESLGLVARSPDPSDGRGSLVALTKAGQRVQEQAFGSFLEATKDLLGTVATKKLDEIDRSLRALLEIFEGHFESRARGSRNGIRARRARPSAASGERRLRAASPRGGEGRRPSLYE
ncbi:MAG: MarR family transcriptional regulator [Deltaproteobacteria bacterium]|nr:MarR family transcriptional regulator [Deltaproteobacteria bacterium]